MLQCWCPLLEDMAYVDRPVYRVRTAAAANQNKAKHINVVCWGLSRPGRAEVDYRGKTLR